MAGKDLTQGSIPRIIAGFALPYLLAYFLQIFYGLADLFIIGQFCGVASTTAVSIGSQIMHMITVMIVGLAMGTTVTLARAIGAKDDGRASSAIGNTVTLFVVVSLVLAALLLVLTGPIVRVMSTPAEAAGLTRRYLTICFLGIPFITAYNIIASIFRGMGDSRTPMVFVAIACVLNIALDYLFIGVFHLDAAGAALGTTLSQTASVVIALVWIRRKGLGLRVGLPQMRPQREAMNGILRIGVPISLQDGFIQIAFLVITMIANRRGLVDAAAVGIVEKIIGMLFLVPSAMLSTVSTLCAQNLGAGLFDRSRSVLRYALGIIVSFGLVVSIVIQFTAESAVGLFTTSPDVILSGGQYLRTYVWDCIVAGIHFCFSGFFCACGYAIFSFIHNIISALAVRIPLSWLLSVNYPDTLAPMGCAVPIGSFVSVLICLGFYVWILGKRKQKF